MDVDWKASKFGIIMKLRGMGVITFRTDGSVTVSNSKLKIKDTITLNPDKYILVRVRDVSFFRFLTNTITHVELIKVSNDISRMFKGLTNIKQITYNRYSFANVTDLTGTFYGLTSVEEFKPFDIPSSITELDTTWYGCSGIKSFKGFDFRNIVLFKQTWEACSSLVTFQDIKFHKDALTNFTWAYCTSLKELPFKDLLKGTYSLVGTPLH